jgi:flagellar basal body-associated protein FliL
MAEIHVQAKNHSSGSAWVLILVLLLITASIVYYIFTRNRKVEDNLRKMPDAASELRPQAQPAIQERPRQKIQIVYLRTV